MTSITTEPVSSTRLTKKGKKALVAGSIGNAVEFVDWAIYSTFVSIFAHHFFPPGNDIAALLSTLAIFAVGFIMRPIGAAVMGAYADRHGRKKGLLLTISMMACATLVIGIAPTYEQVGIVAPIILVLARLTQGFAAGGEFGSASAFMVESAAPARRAFAGSWQQVSTAGGVLIAVGIGTTITTFLPDEAVDSWGWRAAFVFAAMLGVVGVWLRRTVEETDSHATGLVNVEQAKTSHKNAFMRMVREHPKSMLRVFGITIAGTLLYYLWINFMPTYASVTTGIPLNQALAANFISIAVFIVLLPFGGILSDKIGRKPTMAAFAGGFLIFAWPAFTLIGGGFWSLLLVELIGVFFLVGYSANCAVIMAEQFPPEVRATGIGLPYALAVAMFGGTAPYITTWMSTNGLGEWVWVYAAGAAAIGLVVYLTMPETKGKALD